MDRICVFCGSNAGTDGRYREAAVELGRELARRGLGLVYGGGSIGLMGVLADTVLECGGEVIGVIPSSLATREIAHQGLTRLEVVPSMHARKALMAELADAFIALPGGFGTFEEVLEVITWCQLGIHAKPVGILNVKDYYGGLIQLIEQAVEEEFIRKSHRKLLLFEADPSRILDTLASHSMPPVRKWITAEET